MVHAFRSRVSGLRVVKVDCEGPMVNLFGVLATEAVTTDWAHKDDGLPHTLEHLVFLGSEQYPFKGVLDKLANRCLAQGTNAWTATDHTAYTVTTAGNEGFLNILPVFVDHILRPTLTDEGFLTEVHHVTGEGEDKGVVYCEMQGRENTGGSLVNQRLRELLYPDPACGYSSETGGMMKNLRDLTVGQVRRYHHDFYCPQNLCLIVMGRKGLEPRHLLASLKDVELRAMQSSPDQQRSPDSRPWTTRVEPLRQVPEPATVRFPSEDESTGMLVLAWRGVPFAGLDTRWKRDLLWRYLTESAASPLTKAFVESDDALCAAVSPFTNEFQETSDELWFDDVDKDRMDEVEPLFERIVREEVERGVDLSRMRDVIGLERRRYLSNLEDKPGDTLLDPLVQHFLYADRTSGLPAESLELRTAIDAVGSLDRLAKEVDGPGWTRLLREMVLDAPRVSVAGVPSAELAREMEEMETAREQAQAAKLGPARLQELSELLADADRKNNEPTPSEVLTSVPMPQATSIANSLFPLVTVRSIAPVHTPQLLTPARTGPIANAIAAAFQALPTPLPCAVVQLDHLPSEFVRITAAFDTSALTPALRMYLPLLDEAFFKQAVLDEQGQEISYTQVVNSLERDLVSYWSSIGNGQSFNQTFFVVIRAEQAALETAMTWMRRVLFQVVLDPERIKVAATKLLNEVPGYKRSGNAMAAMVGKSMNFSHTDSNHGATAALRQSPFLIRLLRRLAAVPQDVVAELDACRRAILRPDTLRLQVAGGFDAQGAPARVLGLIANNLCPQSSSSAAAAVSTPPPSPKSFQTHQLLSEQGRRPRGDAVVMGLSAIDNAFLTRTVPGLTCGAPELPSLEVAIEYLTALEGPFWVEIRGKGLAYGSSLVNREEQGLIYFGLYRSADSCAAFEAAKRIVLDFAEGRRKMDPIEFENAKGSLISGYMEGEGSRSSAFAQSFLNHFRDLPADNTKRNIEHVLDVDIDSALAAVRRFLAPLFQSGKANTAVAVPREKMDKVASYFQDYDKGCVQAVSEAELDSLFSLETPEPPVTLTERWQSATDVLAKRKTAAAVVVAAAVAVSVVVLSRRRDESSGGGNSGLRQGGAKIAKAAVQAATVALPSAFAERVGFIRGKIPAAPTSRV